MTFVQIVSIQTMESVYHFERMVFEEYNLNYLEHPLISFFHPFIVTSLPAMTDRLESIARQNG